MLDKEKSQDSPPLKLENAIGYVECLSPQMIRGWTLGRSGTSGDIKLEIAGETVELHPMWLDRQDVTAQLGIVEEGIGFEVQPIGTLAEQLGQAIEAGASIQLLVDGSVLPLAEGIVPSIGYSAQNKKRHLSREVDGLVESIKRFTITGWAVVDGAPFDTIELFINGALVECSLIRIERQDVKDTLKIDATRTGFELEMTGTIWGHLPLKEDRPVEVWVDGTQSALGPLTISRLMAADWVEEIASMEEGPEKQYHALKALEHVRFGRLEDFLSKTGLDFVRAFAVQMNLDHFVFSDLKKRAEVEHNRPEDVSTLLLWEAMRDLNSRLGRSTRGTYDLIKQVLETRGLRGQAKDWYLNLAVQLTCASGEFIRLRELIDFKQLYKFEKSLEPHQMTIALPALVAENYIDRASDLLLRLSKCLSSGWIHTEAILYAVKRVQWLEEEGDIDFRTAERFRRTIITLLDGFKGDWFSRLHDRGLIDVIIELLLAKNRYTDSHKHMVVMAAIRFYGLSPTFWNRLELSLPEPSDELLSEAKAAWRTLRTMLEDRDALTGRQLENLLVVVDFFNRLQNPEATIVLREIVANYYEKIIDAAGLTAKALMWNLLSTDASEAIRLAAFPFISEDGLLNYFPWTADHISLAIRKIDDYEKSDVYEMQRRAAYLLQSALEARVTNNQGDLKSTLCKLHKNAIALSNWNGNYLGADLLASAYTLAVEGGLDATSYLMRLGEVVRNAIDESRSDWYLPPPVAATLVRLAAVPGDAKLHGFLSEMWSVIKEKFDHKIGRRIPSAKELSFALAQYGWPRDTLVVIDSCQNNLTTNVRAIQESWLQDLRARKIAYLIAVGGGNDSVQGNVLALNVSDRREDRPQKTLRLLAWACRHTDAQYVLKIRDDCYLDVAQFFNSLSYRKHYYYGRILRHDIGGMDRVWHLNDPNDSRGLNIIDKSPEPSSYAEGANAYCLSRQAIIKLLELGETVAGQRLIGGSTREDKLVGDLLTMVDISPEDEDYASHRMSRINKGGVPVSMDINTFLPSRLSPTKVVRLDGGALLNTNGFDKQGVGLWPKKIWPTCWKPRIHSNSNQLELLTAPNKAYKLLGRPLVVIAAIRNEMLMLPHFLYHYRSIGVECFIISDNCSNDGSREFLLDQPDVVLYSTDTEYKHSHYGVAWQQAILGNHCLGKWALLADADEFLIYEDCENVPLLDFVKSIEQEHHDSALVYMIDMYPYGDLEDACFRKGRPFEVAPCFDKDALIELRFGGGMYSNSRNFVNGLRHRLAPSRINAYVSQKYALFRYQPWMRLTEGVHYAANINPTTTPVFFAHFKYHAGFKEKVHAEIKRNQHFNGAEEYRRYADMLKEGRGNFGASGITQRYESSESFVNLLKSSN